MALPGTGLSVQTPSIEKGPASAGPRSCGECTACCVITTIPELEKKAYTPCGNLQPFNGHGSCGVYKHRPTACRKFNCWWVQGHGPSDLRPDKSGVMAHMHKNGTLVLQELWVRARFSQKAREVLEQTEGFSDRVLVLHEAE